MRALRISEVSAQPLLRGGDLLASRVFDAWRGLPQVLGHNERVDLVLPPPSPLITCCVILTVVDGAERHRELVAHVERDTFSLSIADVMGVGWGATADEAWLLRDEAKMFF
jgi:hypothetical protein